MESTLLDFTTPHLLRDEAEYEAAVAEIDNLLDQDPAAGTPDYERLEFLSVLVQAYEEANDPIDDSLTTPQSVVHFMLEQKGMDRSALVPLLGTKSRVSEFLNGVRSLSINQVRTLHEELGIPTDLLIGRSGPRE